MNTVKLPPEGPRGWLGCVVEEAKRVVEEAKRVVEESKRVVE